MGTVDERLSCGIPTLDAGLCNQSGVGDGFWICGSLHLLKAHYA